MIHLHNMYTLIPLGNPGEKYARTRHNAARIVLAYIEQDIAKIDGCEVFVPKTFMNESGRAVSEYLRFHEGRTIVILYDDKDLSIGNIRISHDRGDGGHNGVKSIIESLGTRDFTRIRIGIAPHGVDGKEVFAPHGEAVQGYVMGNLRDDEMEILRATSTQVLNAIKLIEEKGYQKAMEVCN